MVYQVPKTLSIPKAFQIPGYCHWIQDTSLFQALSQIPIKQLVIYLTSPASDHPKNKIKKDGNCFSGSSLDLKILDLLWV